jgi:uncharacterized membrane protein
MLQFPPLPVWESVHPLIVHIPIGLLFVAPLFVLLGAVLSPSRGKPFLLGALILMLLGTASTYVAVESGEAAGELAERTPEINAVLQHHEQLAERTRLAFSVLTVVFAAILLAPRLLRHDASKLLSTAAPLVFLLFYALGVVLLANTGHNGARLVHEYGVHAMMGSTSSAQPAMQSERSQVDSD